MMRSLAISAIFLALLASCGAPGRKPILVLAAASLSGPLDSIAASYAVQSQIPVRVAYGSSGTLAQQIRTGVDADIFLSADTAWVEKLGRDTNIELLDSKPLLRNRLVLVTSKKLDVMMRYFGELDSPSIGKIAIADPQSAPAGRYARSYMENIGVWSSVQSKLVVREDVRAAMNVVRLDLADVGIVYATDAASSPDIRIVREIPDSLYPPIVYKLALFSEQGRGLYDYLSSVEGKTHFTNAGFLIE